MNSLVFNQLTLCTYSTGSNMVREVLEDWLSFLGGRPARTIVAASPADALPPVYHEMLQDGTIDQILPIEPQGRGIAQLEPEAVRLSVEAAPTEWVLLIKLDTLPYRRGHDDWLEQAMRRIEQHRLFGLTGSFLPGPTESLEDGYSLTAKYSNNFSIFRRDQWLPIVHSAVGADFRGPLGLDRFPGDLIRFATEAAIEAHLAETGQRMLMRWESPDWSVFHVNVWGEQLRRVRDDFLAQTNQHSPFRRTPQAATFTTTLGRLLRLPGAAPFAACTPLVRNPPPPVGRASPAQLIPPQIRFQTTTHRVSHLPQEAHYRGPTTAPASHSPRRRSAAEHLGDLSRQG